MAFVGVLVYTFVFVFQPEVWIPAFSGVPLREITLLVTTVLLFPALEDGRVKRLFSETPQTWLLAFFGLWSVLTVHYNGLSFMFGNIGYKFLKYFLCYCTFVLALDTLKKIRTTLVLMIFLGAFISINGIIQLKNGAGIAGQTLNWHGGIRWIGFFDGSDGTGLLLVTVLGFSIGFLFSPSSFLIRLLFLTVSFLLGYGILLTGSRGDFLGLVAVLTSYVFVKIFKFRTKKVLPIGALCLVLGIILMPVKEGRGLGESTSSERIELLYQGLQMIKNHPIKGIGAEEFAHSNPVHKVAHNIWLQHAAETGMVGVTTYTLMFFIAIRRLLRCIFAHPDDPFIHSTAIQIIGGTVGFFSCAFFLSLPYVLPYVILALITALPFSLGEKTALSKKDVFYTAGVNLLLLACVYIMVNLFFIIFR